MAKTTVVHCKIFEFDVYIGRPSEWGNPFRVGIDGNRKEVLKKFSQYINEHPELIEKAKKELKGKRLGCWCKPLPCHGDILVKLIGG
jgi:hypothetical protein